MAKSFFEGWYLKHQIGDVIFSFIISFHIEKSGECYAYIQFISNEDSYFKKYDADSFMSNPNEFRVLLDNNQFSSRGIKANIDFDDFNVNCDIKYADLTQCKDILGPFKHIPLQCNHSILSLTHDLSGYIIIDGTKYSLNDGVGYIEKDFGKSFPKKYFWAQCNFFDSTQNSVFVACATVPILLAKFNGVICEIFYKNKHYRLATYNGVKIIELTNKKIHLKQGRMELIVEIINQNSHKLYAPKNGAMSVFIHESPASQARFIFIKDGKTLFNFEDNNTSFEFFE